MDDEEWTVVLSKADKRVDTQEKLISSAPILNIPNHPSISQQPTERILYIDLNFTSAQHSGLMRFDEKSHWLDTTILDILPNYASTVTEIDLQIDFRAIDTECDAFRADRTELICRVAKILDRFLHLRKLVVRIQMPFKNVTWNQLKNAAFFYGMYFKKLDVLYRCTYHGKWMHVEYGDAVDRFLFARLKHFEEFGML